jgi:DNA-binding XRE family transcriptional regulator
MVRVAEVKPAGEYKLRLKFTDGSSGVVDIEPTIKRIKQLKPLLDKKLFAQVKVAHGTVCWPGDLDLSPETLYAQANDLPVPKTFEDVGRNELVVGLRAAREASGMTQVELAEELGLPQSNISRIETSPDMKLSSIRRYVEAIGGELEVVAVVRGKRVRVA